MDSVHGGWLLPLLSFTFVSSITPGPNNLMLATSGARFGFRPSLPHLLGVPFGFAFLQALCAAGVGAFITALPAAALGLKIAGTAYLVYLAFSLSRGGILPDADAPSASSPLSFWKSALFQFANPKAWFMAVSASATLLPPFKSKPFAILALCAVFCLMCLPCVAFWTAFGAMARRALASRPRLMRVLILALTALTLYTAVAVWI
ncbi:MAG: LysE family translocator [Spirochaetes bacterium]|nr:LysE family translocator [Spirochaetota bacterium]